MILSVYKYRFILCYREVEAKQNTELAMRNMQMELRTALANIKQVCFVLNNREIAKLAFVGWLYPSKIGQKSLVVLKLDTNPVFLDGGREGRPQ